jgi:hypothetical protein
MTIILCAWLIIEGASVKLYQKKFTPIPQVLENLEVKYLHEK